MLCSDKSVYLCKTVKGISLFESFSLSVRFCVSFFILLLLNGSLFRNIIL